MSGYSVQTATYDRVADKTLTAHATLENVP